MRVLYIIIFLVTQLPNTVFSQYKLRGFLGVEGGESFNYILEFTDSSGFIKGYSYTFQQEKREVKAKIEGTINRQTRSISFRETELLYNHGFESRAIICLIQTVLKFVREENDSVFKGSITTSDVDNISCSKGTVVMNDVNLVKSIFENKGNNMDSFAKQLNPPVKSTKYIYDTIINPTKTKTSTTEIFTKITAGTETTFSWRSDSIQLYIWDGGKIDGDIVSVEVDGNYILNKYPLKSIKKKLVIPLSQKSVVINIYADNEGNESPNTANILLVDGKNQHNIVAYNSIGKRAKINIRKNR